MKSRGRAEVIFFIVAVTAVLKYISHFVEGLPSLPCMSESHWIQAGPTRTATTLQWQTVCVSLFLQIRANCDPSHLKHVYCSMLSEKQEEYPYSVLKSHSHNFTKFSPNSSINFVTTSKMWAKSLRRRGLSVRAVSDPSVLKRDATNTELSFQKYVMKYAKVFQLSQDDFQELYGYLLKWDILRVCCGMQMSKHWRKQLERGTESERGSHEVCTKNIDIGAIERSYLQLNLTSSLKRNLVVADAVKPSNVDGDLDGTYCERYRSFVKTNPTGFNVGMNGTGRKFILKRKNNHKKYRKGKRKKSPV